MIFATVGTQLPFDRLLETLDRWAARRPTTRVHAQTGHSGRRFASLRCTPFLAPEAFRAAAASAQVIVGHAGTGTILTAAELGKPVVVMPRRADLGEHRTDDQIATAREMRRLPHVTVAETGIALAAVLDSLLGSEQPGEGRPRLAAYASEDLLRAVAGALRDPAR
jgi:UDP-N-acetylglucosamine transferase subunit ALG13